VPTAVEKERLADSIRLAFPLPEAPRPLIRDNAPKDDFYADIVRAVGSRKWDGISISDWRGIGVGMSVVMLYITEPALAYFLPSLMISGIENDDLEYAIEALLPTNQRWEPGGARWEAFIGVLGVKQRVAIREFLEYTVLTEPECSISRARAEDALWNKLYG
jgi:hypothetical protein